ncbi:MAG: DUF4214 domain-containing protein [Acidimicrobiia bacterium]|nr:DUF4214 domain-containing protein [Acidimicrobiia bacterium]
MFRQTTTQKLTAGLVVALTLATLSFALDAGRAAAAQATATSAAAATTEAGTVPNIESNVSPGVSDSITRLYLAVFDRAPDAGGHQYWVDRYVNGVGLPRIAEAFMSSEEWQRRIGTLTDTQFVTLLYNNVLGRTPDAGGQRYWLDQVSAGLTRTDMLLWFSEGAEFVRLTGTANPEPPPFPAVPANSGTGRRIIYSNSEQRVWIIEASGQIRDSYLVSGRKNVPAPGAYSVYSKSAIAYAGHHGITMNHMVRFAWGTRLSIGFHSIPRYASGAPMQTEAELGTYQSAGCVRQADHKAEALYRWARIGDSVIVLR